MCDWHLKLSKSLKPGWIYAVLLSSKLPPLGFSSGHWSCGSNSFNEREAWKYFQYSAIPSYFRKRWVLFFFFQHQESEDLYWSGFLAKVRYQFILTLLKKSPKREVFWEKHRSIQLQYFMCFPLHFCIHQDQIHRSENPLNGDAFILSLKSIDKSDWLCFIPGNLLGGRSLSLPKVVLENSIF